MRAKSEFVEPFDRTFGRGVGGRERGQQSTYRLAPAFHPFELSILSSLMKMTSPDEFMCHNSGLQVDFAGCIPQRGNAAWLLDAVVAPSFVFFAAAAAAAAATAAAVALLHLVRCPPYLVIPAWACSCAFGALSAYAHCASSSLATHAPWPLMSIHIFTCSCTSAAYHASSSPSALAPWLLMCIPIFNSSCALATDAQPSSPPLAHAPWLLAVHPHHHLLMDLGC
eukprot:1159058-Pelagomonas_calceolata.AAC.5